MTSDRRGLYTTNRLICRKGSGTNTHDNVLRIRAGRFLGFTIVELMVTVAIVGVLAAIAYPQYTSHLLKQRRASAQSFMMEIANREQQYLLDARDYAVGAGTLTTLSLTVPTEVSPYYTIAVANTTAPPPPNYTITATPIAVQVPDGVMTLTHDGNKTRKGNPGW